MSIKSLASSERCRPGDPLSEYPFLNDEAKMLRQIKRPVKEVKALIGAIRLIAGYLDGLGELKTGLDPKYALMDAVNLIAEVEPMVMGA